MTLIRIALLLVGGTLLIASNGAAVSETADCRAQLKRQDEQCQILAEKREAACPGGEIATLSPACKQLSAEIASTCTRKPCAPPPRKGRRAGKGKGGMGMGSGMGMATPKKK